MFVANLENSTLNFKATELMGTRPPLRVFRFGTSSLELRGIHYWCPSKRDGQNGSDAKKLNFARSLSGEDVWRMSGEEDGTSFRFDYFLLFASLSHCLLVPFTSKVCDWKCRCISINLANCSPPRQNSGPKQRKLTASCPSRVFLLN